MKIAVTATGPDLDDALEPRFGRCPYFLIVDPDSFAFEAVENPNVALGGGAGIQSAQLIAEKGAEVVLTGNCGPNAYQTLSAAGIGVVIGCSGPIRQVVEQFKSGQLNAAGEPNVASHFGIGGAANAVPVRQAGLQQPPLTGGQTGMGLGGGGSMGMGRGGGRGMGAGRGGGGGMGRGRGRGMGRGMGRGGGVGRGMGMGASFPAAAGAPPQQPAGPLSKEDELAMLNQQAEALAQQMKPMQDRMRQLEPKGNIGTVTATVDVEKCTGCGICIELCPVEAIRLDAEVAVIDKDTCTGCGSCVNECPNEAISLN